MVLTLSFAAVIAALVTALMLMRRRQHLLCQQIEQSSLYDGLTGLPNRRLFDQLAGQAITQARREDWRLLVMFIDLDGFKQINDTVGHEAGDDVLRQTASRLRAVLRHEEHLARHGGDEFVALLLHVKDLRSAPGIARRLIDALEHPIQVRNKRVRVGASIGISRFPEEGETIEALVRRADRAMRQVKQAGGGTFRLSSGAVKRLEEGAA